MSDMNNKKTLKCTRKVSDVERICEANYERRMKEGLYTDFGKTQMEEAPKQPRKDKIAARKRRSALRTACTACTMAAGGGAAFVGMGLSMGHLLTVVVGLLVAATFLICGTRLEDHLEAGR